jgi:hypothetical protein
MMSIACFNAFGISTTKYASAAQRSTIDTSRTVVIWACSCLWLGEPFQPFSCIGFLFLVIGTLLYNEIIEFPFLGFNENTQRAIAKRQRKDGEEATNQAYMSLSPGAAYDANRNKRSLAGKSKATAPEWDELEQDFQLNTRNQNSITLSAAADPQDT